MRYCFVHAPNKEGWHGEIVLVLFKRIGSFKIGEVQEIISHLYPDDDPNSFHYDQDVPKNQVENYYNKKKEGKMQRRSSFGTFEDLHYDEWESTINAKYPDMFYLKYCKDCYLRKTLMAENKRLKGALELQLDEDENEEQGEKEDQ